jgi:hypothetical protein
VLVETPTWSIVQAPGGYTVAYEPPADLPMRAAVPILAADGVPIGPAYESADGRLVATTADPSVLSVSSITYGFDGDTPEASEPLILAAPRDGATATAGTLSAPPLATNALVPEPTLGGSWVVSHVDYDLGSQAVDLMAIGGIKGEFRGRIYLPAMKTTPSTLIVFLHGRHGSCAGTPANPNRYPCTESQTEIPSYLGYDGAGDALASLGYVVVSVSANAINSNDNQLAFDYGATARGALVLDHIDYLAAANAGPVEHLGDALVGRIDFSAIGLMGHSRGGDGVVRAALLNQNRPDPYNIASVLPLAPVDFGRLTLPEIPMMTILPYCDGDVTNLQGQHFIDDSRAIFGDDVLRSAVLTMGTDHNFYNTIWTPGGFGYSTSDDWGNRLNSVCGTDPSVAETTTRLPAADQYALGSALTTAWFRLTIGGESQFLGLFDGSGGTTGAMRDMGASVIATASGPASSTTMVNSFEAPTNLVRTAGGANAVYCASMSGAPAPYNTPVCATTLSSAQAPHWAQMRFAPSAPATPVMHMTWPARTAAQTPSTLRVDVPASARDVSGRQALTVRAAPTALATAPAHLTITLRDAAGAAATVATSDYSTALEPLPFNTVSGNGSTNLHKTILRQVYIPLSDISGVDLTRLMRIDIAPEVGGEPGGAYLSDLGFTDSAVGVASLPTTLPRLTMSDAYVNEGAGPGTALIAAHLDRPALTPVTGYFEVIGVETGLAQNSGRPFTIPAGQVCAAFDVPVSGNRTISATATAAYTVTASVVGGASTAEAFGRLTIREDDAVVDSNGIVQEMAPEPTDTDDPCGDPLPTVTETEPGPGPVVTETVPGPVVTETVPGPTVTREVQVSGPTVTHSVPGPTVTREVQVSGPTVTATPPVREVSVPGPTMTLPGPTVTVASPVAEASGIPGADQNALAAANVTTGGVKAAATGKFTVSARRVKVGTRPTVKGTLTVAGKPATGKMLVLVDKQVRKTVSVRKGKVTWKLPALAVGRHTVSLVYLGSQQATSKTFKAGTLRVTR